VNETARDHPVGVIGVGNMGGAVAASMVRAGLDVIVYDVRPEAVERLVEAGARSAGSIEELMAEAPVVSLVVVNDQQVRDVGRTMLDTARPGTTILVHSTVRPSTVVELRDAASEKNVEVLDVAVNGGNEKASRGLLTLMIGGDEDAALFCWPVFEAIGEHIFLVGPVGSGLVGKLVNNLIAIGSYALQLEAMQLAHAYGVSEDMITQVVAFSQGDNRGIRTWGRHDRKRRERMAEGTVWYDRMGRDLYEASIAAGLKEVPLPLTAIIAQSLPSKLRERDRFLDSLPPSDPIPRCKVCDQELALAFRAEGTHPECR